MASLPEPQFEEEKDKFESEQLRAVESLYGVEPETMLDEAIRIGLITADTKRRIDAELKDKDHLRLFDSHPFAKAFEALYGRFFFEGAPGPNQPESDKLNSVLRFKIDPKVGLQGRSELQAAMRRLREVGAKKNIKIDVASLPSNIADKQKEIERLTLKGALEKFDGLRDIGDQLLADDSESSLLNSFGKLKNMIDSLDYLNSVDLPAEYAGTQIATKYLTCRTKVEFIDGKISDWHPLMLRSNLFDLRATVVDLEAEIKRGIDSRQAEIDDLKSSLSKFERRRDGRGDVFSDDKDTNLPEWLLGQDFSKGENEQLENRYKEEVSGHSELQDLSKYFSSNSVFKVVSDSYDQFSSAFKDWGIVSLRSLVSQELPNDQSLPSMEEEDREAESKGVQQKAKIFVEASKNLLARMFKAKEKGFVLKDADGNEFDFDGIKTFIDGINVNDNDFPLNLLDSLAKRVTPLITVLKIDATLESFMGHMKKVVEDKSAELKTAKRILFPSATTILEQAFGDTDPAAKQKARRSVVERGKDLEDVKKAQDYFGNASARREFKVRYDQLDQNLQGKPLYRDLQLDISITKLEEEAKAETDSRDRKDRDGNYVDKDREVKTAGITEKRQQITELNSLKASAKSMYESMKTFAEHTNTLIKLKVVDSPSGESVIKSLVELLESLDVDSPNFKCSSLTAIYAQLKPYYDLFGSMEMGEKFDTAIPKFEGAVKGAEKALKTMEENKLENLTDAQASKKIIAAIIAEQNPDMSLADQQKLASMILANDVATIQTEASYAELAKRGGSELLDTVKQAGFRRKLIGFQYKEGDKTVAPFKGLKPEQFNDWAEIERLFKIGRLNHQNGFFVLAAMKEFAPMADGQPIPQIQAVKLEKKLKAALAEELGVDERMDEAGIDKILNKAFADQMKKAQELVKAYFQHFERNEGEWNGNKIKELNLRYARVTEELRLGKINDATFQKRMAELVEEAKEGEVLDQVKFSQDSAMAGYWNSPFSQWFRDRGWDVGQYAKGKAKSVALSGVKLGAFGLWGATKLGLSATLQTALLPLRAVKYPLLLAAKPLIGVINLFRSQKWTPLPRIRDAVRSDAGRAVGYFTTKGGETWKGAKEKGTGVPKAEWGKTPYAGKKYKERTKVDLGSLEEQAKELKAKGDATPVEVAGSPFIDLKKYRDEIAKLDRILAQKPAEERGDSAADKRAA